jgi:hypothetical protein
VTGRARAAAALALVAGCTCGDAAPPSAPASVAAPVPERGCAGGTWGAPAFDALDALGADAHGALYETRAEFVLTPAAAAPLAAALERAAAADADALSPYARVVLQNDAWGLLQRVEGVTADSPERERVRTAARRLVAELALPPDVIAALGDSTDPPALAGALPDRDGWIERDSPMPSLQHERLFGLRRLFRVFERDGARALASQLVAIDVLGSPHLTPIVGEVEVLDFAQPPARRATVLHLDRRALRCEATSGLAPVTHVAHVPGLGANGFLLALDAPVALSTFPCVRCHDDAEPMSLPTPGSSAARLARLLGEVVVP